MLHTNIQAETPQQAADRVLADWQSRKTKRRIAIDQALHADGVAHCCEGCDAVLPDEGAWCSDCESSGTYIVLPERADDPFMSFARFDGAADGRVL